jgi:hypothetical protein
MVILCGVIFVVMILVAVAVNRGQHRAADTGRDGGEQTAAVFQYIYDNNIWESEESRSGHGSELAATAELRKLLPKLWAQYGVQTLLDSPCGDWNWMRKVDKRGITYYGVDIVPAIIAVNTENLKRFTHILHTMPARVTLAAETYGINNNMISRGKTFDFLTGLFHNADNLMPHNPRQSRQRI